MSQKVEAVMERDANRAEQHLEACLSYTSKSNLVETLRAFAENMVKLTAECPDETTHRFLAAKLATGLLARNGGETDITSERRKGLLATYEEGDRSSLPNEEYLSGMIIMFGIRKGVLGGSIKDQRTNKIKQMLNL